MSFFLLVSFGEIYLMIVSGMWRRLEIAVLLGGKIEDPGSSRMFRNHLL
jgi:hypothetical protein